MKRPLFGSAVAHEERPPAWAQWAIATLFWSFVACLNLAQAWWLTRQPAFATVPNPKAGAAAINVLKTAVVWSGGFYLLWIPLTVLVWRVTARWESRTGWIGQGLRHVAAVLVLSVAQLAMLIGFANAVLGNPSGETFEQALIGQVRGRMYLQVLIYAAIVASGQAMLLYRRSRARELQAARLEAQLSAARLEVLRAQLHPHFLFNSLHAIASLVRDQRNGEAVKLISGLSDLLRRVLDSSDAQLSLAEEIELVHRFVEIQQARFGERVRVSFDVDPLAALARVPALLIQPLVENAIRHGLAPKVSGGTVAVRIRKDGELLRVDVEDTGVGVPADWTSSSAPGTGLRNLTARLAAHYGKQASITAGPSGNDGFRVSVVLPFRAS
jgi:signal transduction histidine kinase